MKRVLAWFEREARDLPWRSPEATPWGVLVSEIMLQQTPAARVIPQWHAWMDRWPSPDALARASSAEVLHAWGRLGYPRRALRLREAAQIITDSYGGVVPSDLATLRSLPGIGEYTAAAIRSFAFGLPAIALDVNIRRVLSRVYAGVELTTSAITRADRERGARAWEESGEDPRWNAAIMECGALVCTARSPLCEACPIASRCAWREAGYPPPVTKKSSQAWVGTDRQARGTMMAYLRTMPDFSAPRDELLGLWDGRDQAEKALQTLADDGLIHEMRPGLIALGSA